MAGRVRVDGVVERRPDRTVTGESRIEVDAGQAWASRGALKLAPALDRFGVDPAGRVCADIGASTGGFTDVLLRRGAARVYAVDVGRGQLHRRLSEDPRVVVMDRVNARELESFPKRPDLVAIDVSFIGLEKVLPAVRRAVAPAEMVVLFKPQFQVARGLVGRRGVVRDPEVIAAALAEFEGWCEDNGFTVLDRVESSVAGPEGNREVLVHLRARP